MTTINATLTALNETLGLNQVQIGPLSTPVTISFYEKWISQNFQGQMSYLKDHLPQKKNPNLLHTEELHSVITVTQAYYPVVQPLDTPIPARLATYAQNKDYHFWLKEKLTAIISDLKEKYPEHSFLPYVDSGPILERNWAYENGMGWFGRNTCLIHPKFGSLFFIAEILTTLPLDRQTAIEPLPDFCGTCQKCIQICPTNALKDHVVEAELCISYLTIESKTSPPVELRSKMGDWFFGCDLCQTVCPWNEKVFRQLKISGTPEVSTALTLSLSTEGHQNQVEFFTLLLSLSNKQIAKKFYGTPLFRAGGNGLKRNALIVIANRKMSELAPSVSSLLTHPKLAELAQWCLSQLESSAS